MSRAVNTRGFRARSAAFRSASASTAVTTAFVAGEPASGSPGGPACGRVGEKVHELLAPGSAEATDGADGASGASLVGERPATAEAARAGTAAWDGAFVGAGSVGDGAGGVTSGGSG